MRTLAIPPWPAALGALLLLAAFYARGAVGKEPHAPTLDLKAGQELTIPIAVVDGHVTLGAPRPSKLGTAQPREGEITVGLTPGDKATLLSQLLVTERTAIPIDFVATGLIGEIKIDERVICGRTDAPVTGHIGSVSWRVSLNTFTAGKGNGSCE
jgi:hypothetical protein